MKELIIKKIKEAGVVGAGGAGLPSHIKADASVDTVLVNGASCEPLLMSDPYLMETHIDGIARGLKTLMDCTGASRGIICLKGKHKAAMASVKQATDEDPRLEAFELADFYPAGDEQVLVREVLGRTVPERGIPLQVGAVVSNVETLLNVDLAMEGKPVTHRWLTVGGEVRRPGIVKAPVGIPVSDVLNFAGGASIAGFRVIDGGPMMGRVLPNIDQPVSKTTSGLLVLPENHPVVSAKIMDQARIRRIASTICCQCSMCTDLCPRNILGHSIHPHKLMRGLALAVGTTSGFSGTGGVDSTFESRMESSAIAREALLCSECGVCEKFACPMGISPREVNAQIKKVLLSKGIRWESRQEHIPSRPTYVAERHIPTKRLVQRLGLAAYDGHPDCLGEIGASLVKIPLRQHIGAAAVCVVAPGDQVKTGDLLGEIPEKAMGARVHASIDGIVEAIADGMVVIRG